LRRTLHNRAFYWFCGHAARLGRHPWRVRTRRDAPPQVAGETRKSVIISALSTEFHPMFVHSVYFWLDPKLTAKQHKLFVDRLNAMLAIPSIKWSFVGTPAETDRPIIDRTYSYKLITAFEDEKGHDEYQVHPLHDAFRELSKFWIKVVIYDAQSAGGAKKTNSKSKSKSKKK
jgi:hypothetical protein